MDKIKVEAFLSPETCPVNDDLLKLLNEIRDEFAERVEIIIYSEHNELFENYNLTAKPAIVIEEIIKIMGFCPSKESIISGMKEVGLE